MSLKSGKPLKSALKKEYVEKICKALEETCCKFSITIERIHKTSASESVYYKIRKKGKWCKLRISCHKFTKNKHSSTPDVIIDARNQDAEIEMEKVRNFFNIY